MIDEETDETWLQHTHAPHGPVRTRALVRGRGPCVVLLHGLGGVAEEILGPFDFLSLRYRLIALDRPGYGGSDPLPEGMSAAAQAAWLARCLALLDADRVLLLAHSIAAAPALWLAAVRPDLVTGLVLVTPFCRPTRPAAMPLLRIAAAPVAGWPIRRALPAVAPLLARHKLSRLFPDRPVPQHLTRLPFRMMAQPAAIHAMAQELRAFNACARPLALRLRRITARTVVIGGGEDGVAPWDRHAAWLAGRLPHASAVCLRNIGHMAHHLRPRLIAAAVESARAGPDRSPLRTL